MADLATHSCHDWPIRQELDGVRASRAAILARLRAMRPQSPRYLQLQKTLATLTARQLKLETLLRNAERGA